MGAVGTAGDLFRLFTSSAGVCTACAIPIRRAVRWSTRRKKACGARRPDQGRTPVRDRGDGSRMRRRATRPDHGRTPVRDRGDGSRMRRGATRPDHGRTT
jgi:hypothetical protein